MNEEELKLPLYGLILTGGRSTRMKEDKAKLSFHGKKQMEFVYELLLDFCENVFLSCRKEQSSLETYMGYPHIYDISPFENIGPLGGIMSAMTEYPDTSFLVLACDLPFVNHEALRYLLSRRNPSKIATAFLSVHTGLPEPLCTVYERFSMKKLREYFDADIICPRKILDNSNVELITQLNSKALENINTPEEYQKAKKEIEHE